MRFEDLQEVQSEINEQIRYVSDSTQYSRNEQWEIAETAGDCEDYALAKLHALLDRGWPIEQLKLATCWTENNEYHAVLIVDYGQATESMFKIDRYVMDNRSDIVYPIYRSDYKWDKIQKEGGSQTWVKM